MSAAHTIVVRQDGPGFVVTIEPAPSWSMPMRCERPTHRAALRCADGMRIVHGWPIHDKTGERR